MANAISNSKASKESLEAQLHNTTAKAGAIAQADQALSKQLQEEKAREADLQKSLQAAQDQAAAQANQTASDEQDLQDQLAQVQQDDEQAHSQLQATAQALQKLKGRDVKLVKALKAVAKKKADVEEELADEQDRSSKLEESVKELAAQVEDDEAQLKESVSRENATRLATALRKTAKENKALEHTIKNLRTQLSEAVKQQKQQKEQQKVQTAPQ